MFQILFVAVLWTAFDIKSQAQITTEEPSKQALKKEPIMLPYILKKAQQPVELKQDHNKGFMLLTKNADDIATEQSQQSLASKTHKLANWDRHSGLHYPSAAHIYPWRLPYSHLYGSATSEPCYSAEPTNIVLLLNIGVLAYVLVAVVGLLNRLHHMSAGHAIQENYDAAHIYYKNIANDDSSAVWQ